MRRRLCFPLGILLFAVVAFALLNWNEAALPGKALPPPFDGWAVPDVPMNAALYVAPRRPSAVFIRGGDGQKKELRVISFEGVAIDPVHEYAARAELADAEDVSEAADALEEGMWSRRHPQTLWYGEPDNAWAETVRTAWGEGALAPWKERDATVRRGWLLLPDDAPSPLLGLGFIRNREDLLDRTFGEVEVEAEGLGAALRLARINMVSFGLFGEFDEAPPQLDSEVLRGTNSGVIVVGESSYPAFVVGLLWDRVASAAELDAITLGGEQAHYRSLEGDWHMTAKRYGRTFYFAVAASRTEAEGLVVAIIESQRSRRGE